MVKLKLTTYNVKGLRNEKKRRKIFNHLHKHKFNIALLQETHSIEKDEAFWRAEWGGGAWFSHGTSSSKGVAILIDKKLNYKINSETRDDQGRFLILSVTIDDFDLVIASIYAPNEDDESFFANVFVKGEQIQGHKIYAGDFNTVLDLNLDKKGGKGFSHDKVMNFVKDYMVENELIDIWRVQHPNDFLSTYIQSEGSIASALMERIDYILIDKSLHQYVQKTGIMPAFASDHANPYIEMYCSASPPGPGYWKLNITLLEDNQFIEDAIKRITDSLSDSTMDIMDRWELMKFSVKQAAIIRSAQIAKSDRDKLQLLSLKLEQITKQRDSLHLPPGQDSGEVETLDLFKDHNNQIKLINEQIEEITSKRTEAAMMRCKAMWYEYSEKSSAYFHSLEKHRYNRKTIHRIMDREGEVISDPDKILNILNEFYKNLFRDKTEEIDPDYLALLNIPQVKDSDKYWLEADIQLEEIHLALKSMNPKKCPGTDGLPMEFYAKFWPMIATTITKLFNVIIKRKLLHKTAREGITSLMGKLNRDPLKISNWRPLSLLNTDYKLFAKVLASRMMHTAQYLISDNQKGFMKKRSIADNLLNLFSVVEYCNTSGLDSILVSVDFHSAFDSCSWKAIKETLKMYGYPQKFIDMVMVCYTDIKTAVMNNNTWSEWIVQESGVKQGCPLSGLLFNHLISVIEMKIQQNNQIIGIQIPGSPNKKIDMFADDIWNTIKFDQESFSELMFEYEEFRAFSGLAINYNKTEIMRMGSIRSSNAKFYSHLPLQWSDGPVKVLGMEIFPSWKESAIKNYEGVVRKAENTFKVWKWRSLTPLGKIHIVNSITNSYFTYQLQVLPSPTAQIIAAYKKAVISFIWDGKKPRIAYNRLIADTPKGGLKLRDISLIDKALKFAKIQQLLDANHRAYWKTCFSQVVGVPFDVDYLFSCNMQYKDVVRYLHDSWNKDLVKIWSHKSFKEPCNVNEILAQNLWYNSNVKFNNKWIYYQVLYNAGITKINHLFDLDTGEFMSYEEFVRIYGQMLNFNFVTYYSVTKSVPQRWYRILRANEPSVEDNISWNDMFNDILSKGKPSRVMYNYLRDEEAIDNSTLRILWNNDLKGTIEQKKFEKLFRTVNHITTSTKLRYFQYRILVRALILNIHVSKWNVDVSQLCSFCNTVPETTIHFFVECSKTKKIWFALEKWCKYMYDAEVKFLPSDIILNNYKGTHKELVNIFILIAKFYMYRCRVQGGVLNFTQLIKEINKIRNIEKTIARMQNKMNKFAYKWVQYEE